MDRGRHDPQDQSASTSSTPPLRLDALLEELQEQVQRVRGTQNRVHTLLDAVLTIGSDLDLDVVLHRIVESAVQLVDCRYGALGVLGEEGGIKQFIRSGSTTRSSRASVTTRAARAFSACSSASPARCGSRI